MSADKIHANVRLLMDTCGSFSGREVTLSLQGSHVCILLLYPLPSNLSALLTP